MARGFNPPGTWHPRGRGFCMGIAPPPGQTILFTGQVAWDEDETIVGLGDVALQTRQCFRNIEAVLVAVGGRLEDLVAITTCYTASDQLPLIQQVREAVLPAGSEPVSTSVMVAGLGHPDFLVELTPVAVVPFERFIAPE